MISAAPWADVDVGPVGSAEDVRAKLANGQVQPDHFEISCEFPSGEYYRRRR